MRQPVRLIMLGLGLAVWYGPSPVRAQTCLGSQSFRDNPRRIGLAGVFNARSRTVMGSFAAGSGPVFGNFSLGVAHSFKSGDSFMVESSNLGLELPVTGSAATWCPTLHGYPHGLGLGMSVGLPVWDHERRLVPSLAFAADYDLHQAGDSASATLPNRLGGAVIVRLGFHLVDSIWLRYGSTIPLGGGGGPSFNGMIQMGF